LYQSWRTLAVITDLYDSECDCDSTNDANVFFAPVNQLISTSLHTHTHTRIYTSIQTRRDAINQQLILTQLTCS